LFVGVIIVVACMQVSTEDKHDVAKNSFKSHCEKLEQACINSVVPYKNLLGDLNNK
jgi:hypothetical protein